MIFSGNRFSQVLSGAKTQTRRPKQQGERLEVLPDGTVRVVVDTARGVRIKWQVGRAYAVQPGRGKHGQGHFTLRELREERVGDITDTDARREGMADVGEFFRVWQEIYGVTLFDESVWVLGWDEDEVEMDTLTEFRIAWRQAMTGQTKPWDEFESELNAEDQGRGEQ